MSFPTLVRIVCWLTGTEHFICDGTGPMYGVRPCSRGWAVITWCGPVAERPTRVAAQWLADEYQAAAVVARRATEGAESEANLIAQS